MPQSTEFHRRATAAYIAPFLAFVGIMAVERMIPLPPQWLYLVRFLVVVSVIGAVSWPYLSFRPRFPLASIAVGVAVFLIWVAPDVLFGYRHHWLFENSLTGAAAPSLPPHLKSNVAFIVLRAFSCAIVVPILEELFWRGWLMRWLIDNDFLKVPLGNYVPFGLLDCGPAVCLRTRTVLGGRSGRRNRLQLVDRTYPESGRLHSGARRYQRRSVGLRAFNRSVAILAITE